MSRKAKEAQEIIKKIKAMDVKSDHFFEVYKATSDKYWDFGHRPSDLQKAASTLVMFAERGRSTEIIVCTKIADELLKMKRNNCKAGKLTIGFEDEEYRIDIYTDGIELGKMDHMLEKAVKSMTTEGEE